jgi:peptide/nickel transport system substrate-binding protein
LGAAALGARPATPATLADTFVIANRIGDIMTLDPQESFEFSGNEINADTYERVMNCDATDRVDVKSAARGYTVSDEGNTEGLEMREAWFASRAPFMAEDVAFSRQRGLEMNKSPGSVLDQLARDEADVDKLVQALDPKSSSIRITEDFGAGLVPSTLSANIPSVVEKKVVLRHEKDGDLGNGWLETNHAGSDAFVLRSWKPNESVVLEANPTLWRGAPKVKRVVIRHVPEPAIQRLLLEKGDVDMARNLSADQIAGLAGIGGQRRRNQLEDSGPRQTLNRKDERARPLGPARDLGAARTLAEARGLARIFSSHELVVVGQRCPRLAIARQGRIVEEVTAEELARGELAQPRLRQLLAANRGCVGVAARAHGIYD